MGSWTYLILFVLAIIGAGTILVCAAGFLVLLGLDKFLMFRLEEKQIIGFSVLVASIVISSFAVLLFFSITRSI